MVDKLRYNANMVDALGAALRDSDHGLNAVPGLLKSVLKDDAWQEFITQLGEVVTPKSFTEFVETPPLKGLGSDIELVKRIIQDDPEVLKMLDEVTQKPNHRPIKSSNNVTTYKDPNPRGNSEVGAIRRLRKSRPDLLEKVTSGQISAHAAAIEAGFRPKTVSVPIERPDSIASTLKRHMAPRDLERLAHLLLGKED